MIQGEGFALRTVRETDLERFYRALMDVEARGDYMQPRIVSHSGFRKDFDETGFWTEQEGFLLIVDDDDRLLGRIGCFRPTFYVSGLEIGYQLFNPALQGKGLMTKALRLFCSFLFSSRTVYRLQVGVMVGNEASRRVAQKIGFQSEGVLRGAVFHRGAHHDLEILSLLRDELEMVPPFTRLEGGRGAR